MRKFLLLCFISASLLGALVPVPARAVFPVIALPQVGLGFASATSFGSFVNYAAVAVGAALAYAGATRNAQDTSGAVEVKIQLSPDAPMDTPSGWTPSNGSAGSGGKPTPPGNTAGTSVWTGGASCSGTDQPTVAKCIQAYYAGTWATPSMFDYPECVSNCTSTVAQSWRAYYNGSGGGAPGWTGARGMTAVVSCPTGYTAVSGVCTLSDATIVQKPSDGVCTIKRTGNSYAYDSLDPDCASPTSQVSISGSGNGTFTVVASDGSKVEAVIDQATGKTTVTQSVPNFTTNTTTNNTVVFSAPQTGPSPATGQGQATVEGKSSATVSGTGSLAGTTPSSSEGRCGAPGQPKCDVKIDETGTPDPAASIASKQTEFDQKANERKGAIEAAAGSGQVSSFGLSLSIAWPSESCVNPTFVIPNTGGRVLAPDLCGPSGDIRLTMQWFLGIVTSIYIFMLGATALRGS